MRIVTVYNSRSPHGAAQEFKPAHIQALQQQCAKWAPFATFECLSDTDIPGVKCVPYRQDWPGWWIKLALFDPQLPGDFLFMDTDTVIVGPLDDFERISKLTMLRDAYRDGVKLKEGLQGALFYLPEGPARQVVWDDFMANPALAMRLYARGDQHFFEKHYLNTAARFQDVLPGQIVSWKVHCKNGIVPPDARIVFFHGQPRPWVVPQFLHLYR